MAELQIGQEVLGDFVVARVLGAGGMGKVYLVKSRSTGIANEIALWLPIPRHVV